MLSSVAAWTEHGDLGMSDQSEVIAFLSDGASYGVAVEKIETHISIVFLVGETRQSKARDRLRRLRGQVRSFPGGARRPQGPRRLLRE